jgi:hypothetical protein
MTGPEIEEISPTLIDRMVESKCTITGDGARTNLTLPGVEPPKNEVLSGGAKEVMPLAPREDVSPPERQANPTSVFGSSRRVGESTGMSVESIPPTAFGRQRGRFDNASLAKVRDCVLRVEVGLVESGRSAIVLTGENHNEDSDILADCVVTDSSGLSSVAEKLFVSLDSKTEGALGSSALSGFRLALQKARGLPVDWTRDDLAVAAASNEIAAVGRLLGPRDVNTVCFD